MLPQTDSPFASVIGLGPLKSMHINGGRGKWVTLILGLVCLAAAPVLALLAAYLGYTAYNDFGLRRVDEAIFAPLCFGLGALVLGGFMVFGSWRNWKTAAALYENGLAFQDRAGLRQVRWDEVDSVYQEVTRHYHNGIYTGTTHVYTLRTAAGQKIVLNDILGKNIETLGNEVQRGVHLALFPKYWQMLQSGQKVNFGPMALDREKLYAGKKELRWDEITGVKIQKGQISVKKDKGWLNWASTTVSQVPNFYIFYDLIGRFAKVE